MANKVEMAFEPSTRFIEFSKILPVKLIPKGVKKTKKYQQIAASIV
mgnify:CR=1 FL=1